jgi:hypothetical protein
MQAGPGVHPAPIQRLSWALLPEVKRSECEADHSVPSSAEVKSGGALSPLPSVFMAQSLIN